LPKTNDDGSVLLSADEFVLVVQVLALARALAVDMGAEKNREAEHLLEVRVLKLIDALRVDGLPV
jgi:hypothetical protein